MTISVEDVVNHRQDRWHAKLIFATSATRFLESSKASHPWMRHDPQIVRPEACPRPPREVLEIDCELASTRLWLRAYEPAALSRATATADTSRSAPGTPICVTPMPVQPGCGARMRVAFISANSRNWLYKSPT